MAPGDNGGPPDKSLLTYSTRRTAILTYPLLAQLHTFFPQRTGDIDWKNLRPIQLHSRSSPASFNTLRSSMEACNRPTILLISGNQIDLHKPPHETYVVVGALINSIWKEKETKLSEDTNPWKTTLFQLCPVQQVYTTRDGHHDYVPVLQSNGIGIGREVNYFAMEREMGSTGLVINSRLDNAAFEHGKTNSESAAFEGVSPFGTVKETLLRIEVSFLEVWSC